MKTIYITFIMTHSTKNIIYRFRCFFSLAKLSQLPAEYSQKTMVLGSQNQKPEIGSIDTYTYLDPDLALSSPI